MRESTVRLIVRWIHIICAIPITGYIYSPFAVLPDYAPPTRFVFFPVMLLSGLWMWKGPLASTNDFEKTGLSFESAISWMHRNKSID